MAVFKTLTCQNCQKVRQVASEKPKGEKCPRCGGIASQYSKKWKVSVYLGGDKYVETVSALKAEAVVREAQLIAKAASGEVLTRSAAVTLKEAAETFRLWCCEQVDNKTMDYKTSKRYMSSLNTHVIPALGNVNITRLDHIEIDGYVRHRKSNVPHPEPATINRELTAIHRLLAICVRKRMISRNPMDGYPKLKEPSTRDRCLTDGEIARLLEECRVKIGKNGKPANDSPPDYLETMVIMALHTGLRRDGIMGLRWEHIDWKANVITRTVKGGKTVRIPISERLRASLTDWRNSKPVSIAGWVFPSPKKPKAHILVTSNIGFDAAVQRAGLGEFVFHQLRDTFATHFIQQTRNLAMAAEILGHSTLRMTQKYTHLLDDFKNETMRRFSL